MLKPFDRREVLDVGGDEGGLGLDSGGADERIGQPHAVRQRQGLDQLGSHSAQGNTPNIHLGDRLIGPVPYSATRSGSPFPQLLVSLRTFSSSTACA